jgi:hypothetical protein
MEAGGQIWRWESHPLARDHSPTEMDVILHQDFPNTNIRYHAQSLKPRGFRTIAVALMPCIG